MDQIKIYKAGTMQKFGISEFLQIVPNHYNLDVIISVGYRVKSIQGTLFRKRITDFDREMKKLITKVKKNGSN